MCFGTMTMLSLGMPNCTNFSSEGFAVFGLAINVRLGRAASNGDSRVRSERVAFFNCACVALFAFVL